MYTHPTPKTYPSQRKASWTFQTALTRLARDIAEVIDTAPSRHVECWRGAAWIAKQIGVSVATVNRGLKELELKGLIRIVRDYTLATRRRLLLLWRDQPEPQAETEGTMREEPTAAVVEPEPEPAPPPAAEPATAEERRLVSEAMQLKGARPHIVREYVEACGPTLVRKALDYAVERGVSHWKWMETTLTDWFAHGAPDSLKSEADAMAEMDAAFQQWWASQPVRETPPPRVQVVPIPVASPVRDARPAHLAWVGCGNPVLERLAAKAMRRGM